MEFLICCDCKRIKFIVAKKDVWVKLLPEEEFALEMFRYSNYLRAIAGNEFVEHYVSCPECELTLNN